MLVGGNFFILGALVGHIGIEGKRLELRGIEWRGVLL